MKRRKTSILIMASVRWYNASAHYALYLADYLRKEGINAVIFGIPESPLIKKAKDLKIPVIEDINLMSGNPVLYLKNLNNFKKIFDQQGFDIINPHISRDHTFAFLSNITQGIPIIRTRTDSRPPKANVLNRCFYKYSANHYTVSSKFMESFIGSLGIDAHKISTIPLEMNFEEFSDYRTENDLKSKLNISDDMIIVTFAGRLDTIKGVEFLIRSHPLLKNNDKVHYIISGEEINLSSKRLRETADGLKIKNISIIDRLDDVREILSITDIGVIPSIGSEAICRIALEMTAFGIPVVGSNINSIPETISDYFGTIVRPEKPEDIAEALDKLVMEDNYRSIRLKIKEKLSRRNNRKFIENYLDIFSKYSS